MVEHKNKVKDHRIECSHWLPLKPFCIPNGNPKFTFKIVFTQFFSRICCWICLLQKWTFGQELIIKWQMEKLLAIVFFLPYINPLIDENRVNFEKNFTENSSVVACSNHSSLIKVS